MSETGMPVTLYDETEAELWRDVFIAQVRAGTGQSYAEGRADLALTSWRKRNILGLNPCAVTQEAKGRRR